MLKVNLLSTGSKGNTCLFDNGTTVICIDMGIKIKEWIPIAKEQGYEFKDVEALLVTHAHGDHVNSSMNKYITDMGNENVYLTNKVANDIHRKKMLSKFERLKTKELQFNVHTKIGTYYIKPIIMDHYGLGKSKINECVGFEIWDSINDKIILYASDTRNLRHVVVPDRGYDLLMLEENHDADYAWDIFDMSDHSIDSNAIYTRTKDHMSSQTLAAWLFLNNKNDAPVVPLHESTRNKKPGTIKLKDGRYSHTYWKENTNE